MKKLENYRKIVQIYIIAGILLCNCILIFPSERLEKELSRFSYGVGKITCYSILYIGKNSEKIVTSEIKYLYNSDGMISEISYFDRKKNKINGIQGFHKETIVYNKQNNISQREFYSADNVLQKKKLFFYDDFGRISFEKEYVQNELSTITKYKYGTTGGVSMIKQADQNAVVQNFQSNIYRPDQKLDREYRYHNGTTEVCEYYYTPELLLHRVDVKDNQGVLKQSREYLYDDQMNLKEINHFDSEEKFLYLESFTFAPTGQVTEFFRQNIDYEIIYRTEYFYDKSGKLQLIKAYDMDDELTNWIEYEYIY